MSGPEFGSATYRNDVTAILVNDAVEASSGDLLEAVSQLLDAAGSVIMHAHKRNGADARSCAREAALYLIDQIDRNVGGAS